LIVLRLGVIRSSRVSKCGSKLQPFLACICGRRGFVPNLRRGKDAPNKTEGGYRVFVGFVWVVGAINRFEHISSLA